MGVTLNAKSKQIRGKIMKVAGPVVVAKEMAGAKMYNMVEVSDERLIGEVIELKGDKAVIQVYEETSGLKPGDVVVSTGRALSVELGPGIIGSIYDGIQRPLELIRKNSGIFIRRGERPDAIDKKRKWDFSGCVRKGDKVHAGSVVGTVRESEAIENRIMVPADVGSGVVRRIEDGKFCVDDVICEIESSGGAKKSITMCHVWPVREKRGYAKKFAPREPLVTGQRVIDMFYPVAKGGTAAIPGPFGAGKTVTLHQIAKWADADIIVYVGCGERGNEMTNVLEELPKLVDKNTGKPLMERTILIANTSNMPVAAREASIYTGVTIAEYYRDMGYCVALIADSTSRWAEAMREISSRLEEMPGEEGYPAYLSSRLSEFYERSGLVETLSGKMGSVSIIGAVSPQGGDFSEPVTQCTVRVTKCFWALDSKLADMRHFPAVNWNKSYSLYARVLSDWYKERLSDDWSHARAELVKILKKESELAEVVQLVGMDALPYSDQLTMLTAKIIREDFLQQDVFHKNDTYCSVDKQMKMMNVILKFYEAGNGVPGDIKKIREMNCTRRIALFRYADEKKGDTEYKGIVKGIDDEFSKIGR
ncbi:MAG: V-type ATP synthase subunit A [Candidatus Nanohalarchaeota archaeon]|nr:MAG: V-type ATP synthase subunit A [Candidatus Nanohaloarchaeota archaeon]